ncbi:MAG TPA: single-stranded-DNA-specific exonuclease RecJ [Vicinamibacterales bacterium]|nr:single-stranded-DNA-specific exonuclease RecJ [Vicinamibacterales bacterium]
MRASVRPRRWEPREFDAPLAESLSRDLGVAPIIGRLLAQRSVDGVESGRRFLNPTLEQLHDPFGLLGIPEAVERILTAVSRRERIAVHGDYDVDGVTATVMVRRVLELLNADVTHYIPNRLVDGYGLEPAGVERLHADGAKVIVSVDCGIRSLDAAERARELGVDLIVTDHHEPGEQLPRALAVVNPKRPDCDYPDTQLAGAGVAFKLVQALCLRVERETWLPAFVKIAAIGTIADVVPLHGENRVIAKVGLEGLSKGPNGVGLRALLDVAGLTGKTLDSFNVAFGIAPRVNAAGRMGSPDLAARLLLTSDEARRDEAASLARDLDEENTRRRSEEQEIAAQARKAVESNPDIGAHGMVVVAGNGWHRGVIGIVASKLVETFAKPALVLSIDGETAHGSGRSIPGFDLLSALKHCADVFLRYGGHRQAAGVTLDATRVSELRSRLNAYADERLGPEELTPRLHVDAPLALSDITSDVVQGLRRLEPFGSGNPRPIFQASGLTVVEGPKVLKQRHLTMSVKQAGRVVRAVAWRAAERKAFVEAQAGALDVAYSLMENHFRGETRIELSVADVREPR